MEKIAIIDVGSNSARLVIVDILENGFFQVEDQLKETLRLAQDMEEDGFIQPARIAQTVKTLKMFSRLCDANKIERVYAYATEAIRKAKNQRGFLDEIESCTGIKLKVLEYEEEAKLVYQGVINSLDIPRGLIVDIGGGSTQFIYYNRKNLLQYTTLPLGAVVVTDMFKNSGATPLERSQAMENYVLQQLEQLPW